MKNLDELIRDAAKFGRLNHFTLSATWDGKWEAAYRGVATEDHRSAQHSDPVAAAIGALTGRRPPEIEKPKRSKPRPAVDEDILV